MKDHHKQPASRTKTFLAILRVLQVLLALAATVVTCWYLAALANAVKHGQSLVPSDISNAVQSGVTNLATQYTTQYAESQCADIRKQYGITDQTVAKLPSGIADTYHSVCGGPSSAITGLLMNQISQSQVKQEWERRATIGMLAVAAILLAISFITLTLTFTWSIYTISSRARNTASCCGDTGSCSSYTCDMAWDIVLMVLWLLVLGAGIACAVLWKRYVAARLPVQVIVAMVFCAVMVVVLFVSAVMAGQVRRKLRKLQNEACTISNLTSAVQYPAVPPIVSAV